MLKRRVRSTNSSGESLVNAEELMLQMFVKMIGSGRISLTESICDEALIEESDDVLSQFPILIYKHWIVPRRYIFRFMTQIAEMDANLNEE